MYKSLVFGDENRIDTQMTDFFGGLTIPLTLIKQEKNPSLFLTEEL